MQVFQTEYSGIHLRIENRKQHVSGSVAVRASCNTLLKKLNWDDSVDEHTHPYTLRNSKHLVSFSHTSERVAVAISSKKITGLGIDVEDNHVSMSVAKRFYSKNEVKWLESLSTEEKQHATRLLWMAKEAYIKANNGKLLSGLKIDLSDYITSFKTQPIQTINLTTECKIIIDSEVNFAVSIRN